MSENKKFNGPITSTGAVEGTSFVKTGGASSEFLKADGSVDTSTYITSAHATDFVSAANGGTFSGDTQVNAKVIITDTTEATDSTGATGALRVEGGISSAGHVYAEGFVSQMGRSEMDHQTARLQPLGPYTTGKEVFSINPTWSEQQLQDYFDNGGVTWATETDAPGGYSILITGNIGVGVPYSSGFPMIPIDDTSIYFTECWIKNVGTDQTHYMGSAEKKADFGDPATGSGNPGSYGYHVMSNTNPGNTWTRVTGYITGRSDSASGNFETDANYFSPLALFNYGAGTGTRACIISGWRIVKIDKQEYFADGTAALPAITNYNDPNTGISFQAVDTVNISTGGTNRLTIDSTKALFAGEVEAASLDINGNADISGNLTVTGTNYGAYHSVVDDQYYFDDYNGSRNLSMFYKNSRADIIRYQAVDNYEYWNGTSWIADASMEANVEKLLDGRQDTKWNVPARDYKFRFTTSATTSYPTMAMVWMQTSWSGSTYPGATMLVEEYDGSSWAAKVTAEFTSGNGNTNWGLHARADTALHTGKGNLADTTRITVDFYGWTPSNGSYVTIPLQNLMITSNYAGTENTDYTNLLSHDTHLRLGDNRKFIAGTSSDLQIYHDGVNSYIVDAGTGDLLNYFSNDWKVIKYGSSEICIAATSDGSVDLYYDNALKLKTVTAGVEITGELQADTLDIDGNADISGALTLGTALADAEIASAVTWNGYDATPTWVPANDPSYGTSSLVLVDEDNMASDSATLVPSQQSVKAYADGLASNYLSASGTAADSELFDGVDSTLYQRYRADIGNGIDLDTYTTMGIYNQNSNAQATAGSNYPIDYAGMLTVTADGLMIYQVYQGYSTSGTYERKYYNGSWQAWHLVYDSGIFTDNSGNWDTAYTDRNKWDGGSTGLTAATGRTSLGLGTAATTASTAYATAAQGTLANNALPNTTTTISGAQASAITANTAKPTLIDEDDMSSDSATEVPSQQSVKAYVDGAVIANTDTQNLSIDGQTLSLTSSPDVTLPTQTSVSGNAGTVTVTDNESTAENNLITFVADQGTTTGAHGLEMDGNLYYNPASGVLTSTAGVASAEFTGDLTGNADTTTALATTRALQVTLSETDSANFDGSAAVTDIGVTGTLAVGNGGTGATSFTSNQILFGNDASAIGGSNLLTFTPAASLLQVTGIDAAIAPLINLNSINADSGGGEIRFSNPPNPGEDGDVLGKITFKGDDAAGNDGQLYASVVGGISTAADGAEGGSLTLSVASNDGEEQPGLVIQDGSLEDEVDVTIANGAASITTIAGDLAVTSDLDVDGTTNLDAVDIDGNVQLDGSLTIGANVGSGYDFKLYGNVTNKYIAWDASMNQLKVHDNTKLVFGSGGNEPDYDGAIYWDQTDLVIDSESDLQILSDAIVTGDVTATGTITGTTLTGTSLDINGAADISGNLVIGGTVDGVNVSALASSVGGIGGTAAAALPKTGGTMSGNIIFNSAQPEGNSGLVPAAGTAGHFLKHDGTFGAVPGGGAALKYPLVQMGGRVQHSTSQDNRMIMCGGTYGPSYYIWSQNMGVTATSGGTVDTTTFTLPIAGQLYGGIRITSTGKVDFEALVRPLNTNSDNLPYIFQMWEFSPAVDTTTGPTCTLRGKAQFTSASSSYRIAKVNMVSTSQFTKDNYVFVTLGMDAQTIPTTAYQYVNMSLSIV